MSILRKVFSKTSNQILFFYVTSTAFSVAQFFETVSIIYKNSNFLIVLLKDIIYYFPKQLKKGQFFLIIHILFRFQKTINYKNPKASL